MYFFCKKGNNSEDEYSINNTSKINLISYPYLQKVKLITHYFHAKKWVHFRLTISTFSTHFLNIWNITVGYDTDYTNIKSYNVQHNNIIRLLLFLRVLTMLMITYFIFRTLRMHDFVSLWIKLMYERNFSSSET